MIQTTSHFVPGDEIRFEFVPHAFKSWFVGRVRATGVDKFHRYWVWVEFGGGRGTTLLYELVEA